MLCITYDPASGFGAAGVFHDGHLHVAYKGRYRKAWRVAYEVMGVKAHSVTYRDKDPKNLAWANIAPTIRPPSAVLGIQEHALKRGASYKVSLSYGKPRCTLYVGTYRDIDEAKAARSAAANRVEPFRHSRPLFELRQLAKDTPHARTLFDALLQTEPPT